MKRVQSRRSLLGFNALSGLYLFAAALFLMTLTVPVVATQGDPTAPFIDPESWDASIESLEARHLKGDPQALLVLASIYCNSERWYDLKNLLDSMEEKPYLEDALLYFKGRIALAENRLGSARRAFEQALKANPEASRSIRAQLLFYQAICLLKLNQNEQAQGAFEKALASNFIPESRSELLYMAQFYARFQGSQATLSWLKRLPPSILDSEAELSAILGRAYLKESFPFLAIKAFSQSLSLETKQASILTLRASAYRSVRDYASAEIDIEKAIALEPFLNRAEKDYLYGLILFEAGKLERAHEVFNQRYSILEEADREGGFLLLHAQLAYTVGAMKDAQRALEAFFRVEETVNHFNAYALALLLRLPELKLSPLDARLIPLEVPAIFELSLLKNYAEGRNSLAYLIEQSDSASLTFFLAQIERARGLKQSQARLLKETLLRTKEKTPEHLGAIWQLKGLEN